jgi:hypothetical protein
MEQEGAGRNADVFGGGRAKREAPHKVGNVAKNVEFF